MGSGGFGRIDDVTWLGIRERLPRPWLPEEVAQDMRFWEGQRRARAATRGKYGKSQPGRPTLVKTWGWTEWRARAAMADVASWWDPQWGPPPADLQPTSSAHPEMDAKTQEEPSPTSSAPPADLQPTSSRAYSTEAQRHRDPEDQILNPESTIVDREDPADSVSTSDEPAPEPAPPAAPKPKDSPKAVALWAELQAIRAEHTPGARGQAITGKVSKTRTRQDQLLAACRIIAADGFGREDLLRAARWVFTSENIRASGARSTGDALAVLLEPSKVLAYCGLAEAEERTGSASTAAPPKPAGDPDGLTRGQLSTIDDCRLDLLDEWPEMPAEVQARAVELLRAAMLDGVWSMKAMKDRVRPHVIGQDATVIDFARRLPAGGA